MKQPSETPSQNRNDSKALLSTLKWTTAIGAVSLTLAGWGLLSQAEALNASVDPGTAAALAAAASPADTASLGIVPGAIAEAVRATATTPITPTATSKAKAAAAGTATGAGSAVGAAAALPAATATVPATATPAATATPSAAAASAATATPEKQFTLDVVQWTQNANGEEIAVVRDANGTLWYVWGPDVERIERGLDPQFQPQPVNATGRSRGS
jgi:hypothetical protein